MTRSVLLSHPIKTNPLFGVIVLSGWKLTHTTFALKRLPPQDLSYSTGLSIFSGSNPVQHPEGIYFHIYKQFRIYGIPSLAPRCRWIFLVFWIADSYHFSQYRTLKLFTKCHNIPQLFLLLCFLNSTDVVCRPFQNPTYFSGLNLLSCLVLLRWFVTTFKNSL